MLTPACFIVFTLRPTVGTVWIEVPIAIMLSRVDFPLREATSTVSRGTTPRRRSARQPSAA